MLGPQGGGLKFIRPFFKIKSKENSHPLPLGFKSNRTNETLHLSRTEALHTIQSTALNYFVGHLESQGPVIMVEIP